MITTIKREAKETEMNFRMNKNTIFSKRSGDTNVHPILFYLFKIPLSTIRMFKSN